MADKEVQEMIEWEQKLVLIFGYSYNIDEHPTVTDEIYDYGIKRLLMLKRRHPQDWCESTVCPEVFLDPEEAWSYTSSHFPANAEIAKWVDERKLERSKM
jgi:NAD-dependent DNA ligase